MRTTHLIPEPQKYANKPTEALMHPAHRSSVLDVKKLLRELSKDLLDMTMPFRSQDATKWNILVAEASRAYPLLNEYENRWPIERYMRKYINNNSWSVRRRLDGHHAGAKERIATANIVPVSMNNVRDAASDCTHLQEAHPSIKEALHRTKITRTRLQQLRRARSSLSRTSEDHTRPIEPYNSSRQADLARNQPSPDTAHYSISSGRCSSVAMSESGHLSLCLQSCKPDLQEFLDAFKSAGIANEGHFRILMEFPEAERDAFLEHDMRLNAFQARKVRVGMGYLRQRGMS